MQSSSGCRPKRLPGSAPDRPEAPRAGLVDVVREEPVAGLPSVRHPGWARAFPWLVQGTTSALDPASGERFDLRVSGPDEAADEARGRWGRLLGWTGLAGVVYAHQPHGSTIRVHGGPIEGLRRAEDADGHVTREPGILLAVSVADCVPVSVVDPVVRGVALLHAGWRGAAAGILEKGLDLLAPSGEREHLHVHLGPAICGRCYEVGPEVFDALGYGPPDTARPIDLRAALVERALAAGVSRERLSVSAHCTRCGDGHFFSHRGGDAGRQVGFLGVRP